MDGGISIPPLPDAVAYIHRKHGTKEPVKFIESTVYRDPMVALAVLKAANDDIFQGLTEIDSISGAINRLGFETVEEVVVKTLEESKAHLPKSGKNLDFFKKFWSHAIATSLCAGKIAQVVHYRDDKLVRIGGLLHDIGTLYIHEAMLELKKKHLNLTKNPKVTFKVNDNLIHELAYEFHTTLGEKLLSSMNITGKLSEIVALHHASNDIIAEKPHVQIVALANYICYSIEIVPEHAEKVRVETDDFADALGISTIKIAALEEEVISLQKEIDIVLSSK